ncbi:MAG: Uma2 family endonuclease [Bacteroidia bacterium]|nr:Uma2 family endonuclease [Bacteroidia bacterium]
MSLEEYLRLEEQAECKSEYHGGHIVAMAGATRNHSLIASNLLRGLGGLLPGACEIHGSDLKLYIASLSKVLYPDVTVICGPPAYAQQRKDLVLNPQLIVEVLSDGTEAYDRGDKFACYRQIPTLREYLLVSQRQPMIEIFRREGQFWVLSYAEGLDAELLVQTAGAPLPLAGVYRGVEWDLK